MLKVNTNNNMATMKDAKILGGIGAILSLLSFIPHIDL